VVERSVRELEYHCTVLHKMAWTAPQRSKFMWVECTATRALPSIGLLRDTTL
jgi:hypothetical protein